MRNATLVSGLSAGIIVWSSLVEGAAVLKASAKTPQVNLGYEIHQGVLNVSYFGCICPA